MTAAHAAGLFRIAISPCSLVLLTSWPYAAQFVLLITVLAIISDILDGYLARKFGTVSDLGAILDLTADKMFLNTLLVVFTVVELAAVWMAVVIIMRDFYVMGIRTYSASRGIVIPAHFSGKIKTVVLFGGAIACLVGLSFGWWLIFLASVLSVFSAADYSKKAWQLLSKNTQ